MRAGDAPPLERPSGCALRAPRLDPCCRSPRGVRSALFRGGAGARRRRGATTPSGSPPWARGQRSFPPRGRGGDPSCGGGRQQRRCPPFLAFPTAYCPNARRTSGNSDVTRTACERPGCQGVRGEGSRGHARWRRLNPRSATLSLPPQCPVRAPAVAAAAVAVIVPLALIFLKKLPWVFAVPYGLAAALVCCGFYYWRFRARALEFVELSADGLRVKTRNGVESLGWDQVEKAFHEDSWGLRWRFVLRGGREVLLRDDGYSVAAWASISHGIHAALKPRDVPIDVAAAASRFKSSE